MRERAIRREIARINRKEEHMAKEQISEQDSETPLDLAAVVGLQAGSRSVLAEFPASSSMRSELLPAACCCPSRAKD
jgi:hypothetical protein